MWVGGYLVYKFAVWGLGLGGVVIPYTKQVGQVVAWTMSDFSKPAAQWEPNT